MTDKPWKALERRIGAALGGTRTGPLGRHMSDIADVPFSVECKYTKTPPMQRWIAQARRQGKQEGKPWLLAVSGHNDQFPIVVMDFKTFAKLYNGSSDAPSGAVVATGEGEAAA